MDKNPFQLTDAPASLLGRVLAAFARTLPRIYGALVRYGPEAMRAWPILLFFAISFVWTATQAPAKVGLTIYGLSKISAGGYFGYWIDRIVFPYARPGSLEGIAAGTAQKRRAGIIMACIIAAALIP